MVEVITAFTSVSKLELLKVPSFTELEAQQLKVPSEEHQQLTLEIKTFVHFTDHNYLKTVIGW